MEIIITPISQKKKKFTYAGGSLQKYANPSLRKIEKKALELALKAIDANIILRYILKDT